MIPLNNKKYRTFYDILLITIGSLIMAVGLVQFLIPHKIVTGGVSGIATIIYHIFHIPAGITMLALNIPLFLLGLWQFGKKFGVKTIYGILSLSIFTDLLDRGLKLQALTDDIFLSTLYGGVILGLGLGLIFKGRGTTGGSDIIARIINKYTNLTLGWSFMVIDSMVIGITAMVFGNIDLILFGIIGLVVSSKLVDVMAEGFITEKALIIVSDKWEAISQRILNEIHRGVTGLDSLGTYTNTSKKTLYCVVSVRQVEQVRRVIYEEDENAFVTVNNTAVILGEGFQERTSIYED